MNFKLYKLSGYEESIMSLRISKGKYFSWEKALEIQQLVDLCTNHQGFLCTMQEYTLKLEYHQLNARTKAMCAGNSKITGIYHKDIAEFKRLLELTMNNAMGEFTHHTLMKYIDISFFTLGLHRGAQDDLDAHAIAFNNRITRFSTRLAEIPEPKLSEWYQDKVISFHDAHHIIMNQARQDFYAETDPELKDALKALMDYCEEGEFADNTLMPKELVLTGDGDVMTFKYSPFGYILDTYEDKSHKSGLYKDVARGLMPLGMESNGLWKTDLFNLRYVYHMRSKLTKANPELKMGMELLADQIEKFLPVFGEKFRYVFTDTKKWEHTNKVRTVTKEEYELLHKLQNKEVPEETDAH